MGPTHRRVRILLVSIFALALAYPPATATALTDGRRSDRAIGYIASQQRPDGSIPAFSPIGSTADAVLAIVAAGTGHATMLRALGYLRAQVLADNVNTVGLRAKVAMAVEAAGRHPRRFAAHNLLRAIRSAIGPDGRFAGASVLDQSLALLALEGAGITPPPAAVAWLLQAQCPDGGWQYDEPYAPATDDAHCLSTVSPSTDYFESDTNTSGYAIQALEATATTFTYRPFAFFRALRDPVHRGWGYTRGLTTTDANSTALVIQAYLAAGKAPPPRSLAALRALQFASCGAFAYSWNGSARTAPDIGATIGAVPALKRRFFPFTRSVIGEAPATPVCP